MLATGARVHFEHAVYVLLARRLAEAIAAWQSGYSFWRAAGE